MKLIIVISKVYIVIIFQRSFTLIIKVINCYFIKDDKHLIK